jgi:hypothetical protein
MLGSSSAPDVCGACLPNVIETLLDIGSRPAIGERFEVRINVTHDSRAEKRLRAAFAVGIAQLWRVSGLSAVLQTAIHEAGPNR